MPESAASTWQSTESFPVFYAAHIERVYTDFLRHWPYDFPFTVK